MTKAEIMLKLIEDADPADKARLGEIDSRVWCWMNGYDYIDSDGLGTFRYRVRGLEDTPYMPGVC